MDKNTEIKIDTILETYTIKAPERTVCKQAKEVINDVLGVDLPQDTVSYNKGTIRVDASPLVRSQIHINKQKIFDHISKKLKDRSISGIH
jgi:hypothetical protein